MPSFILSPMTAADIPRLAEIQYAAFGEDQITRVCLADVPHADYIAWVAHGLAHPDPPPGQRVEVTCARDAASGEVAGWAQWQVSLAEDEQWAGAAEEKASMPRGSNAEVFREFMAENAINKERIVGGRKRWLLSLLVVDPAFQRRGVGALLVSDGVARARAQGRPVVVSSSTQGVHLYTKLGFELRETCVVGRAGIEAPILVKEP